MLITDQPTHRRAPRGRARGRGRPTGALRAAGACLLAGAALALAACGSGSGGASASGAAGARQTVRIALDYTANVNYLGIYAAIANGYFARHGVDPQIIPYAETPAEPLIRSGRADLGISYPPQVIMSRAEGLRYKAVAALVAGNRTALAVLSSSPITRPAQLSGKLYGGFGITSDPPTIRAIMAADGAASPKFREVVLNTDVMQALGAHRVDYTAIFEGIDDVTAELQGIKVRRFPYRSYLGTAGDFPDAVFVASDEEVEKRHAALAGAIAALSEGYAFAAANPAQAEQILIRENQTELSNSARVVQATGNATAPRFIGPSGQWGLLSAADFEGLERILAEGGVIHGSPPRTSELYTNSLLPGS